LAINESFEVNDLKLVLEPTLHIDEYQSKIGRDYDIIVVSFFLRDKQAAIDLVNFFEIGYEFILDADISSSEIDAGSFVVFVELMRRYRAVDQIFKLVDDLKAASGYKRKDWKFKYINEEGYHPLTVENIKEFIPLSPRAYKDNVIAPIEEMMALSGLPIREDDSPIDADLQEWLERFNLHK